MRELDDQAVDPSVAPSSRAPRIEGRPRCAEHVSAARMVVVPRTLLIVDDHAGFRSSARALLEADGRLVVVGEAGTGTEAVTAVHRLRPDIVLLDIALPDIDGFAVCESIML